MEKRLKVLEKCEICPHRCKINRYETIGKCKAKATVKVALFSIHKFEEPIISGVNGSGTIFFSNCNLNCQFCQNYEISQLGEGKEISINELAEIFLEEQRKGADNINLVSPTSYAIQIIEALKIARKAGLILPIIYNTNGYENIETINMLKGYVDVYLTDLKYFQNNLGQKYSGIKNYFETATKAIKKMYKQVGSAKFNKKGLIKKGLIIRHLVLPNNIQNSKETLRWIAENMPKDVIISCMTQYFPTYNAKKINELSRKLTKKECERIEKYLFSLNIENCYVQERGYNEEQYVPKWGFETNFKK